MNWQRISAGLLCLVTGLIVVANLGPQVGRPAVAADSATDAATATTQAPSPALTPVEDSMHEFMEYVFQPSFNRLKSSMAIATKDNGAWKAVKADALTLAEGGNLLLMRLPEKDADSWTELSTAVRKLGGELYQAARAKNEANSQRHYRAMIVQCNRCHDKFAEGEHQLAP